MTALLEFLILVGGGTLLGGFGSMGALLLGIRLQGAAQRGAQPVSNEFVTKQEMGEGDSGARPASVLLNVVERSAGFPLGQQIVLDIAGKEVAFEVVVLPVGEVRLSPSLNLAERIVRLREKGEMAAVGSVERGES